MLEGGSLALRSGRGLARVVLRWRKVVQRAHSLLPIVVLRPSPDHIECLLQILQLVLAERFPGGAVEGTEPSHDTG